MIEQFHFIRPLWLFAIIPLLIICGLLLRRRLSSHNWQTEVDEALLPYLLITQSDKSNSAAILIYFIAGLLAVLAMAGPSWEKLPQPVFKKQSALMIVLDLSRSMDAVDLKPNRLTRAKFKISDILKRRQEGQTGLIVYAAAPYVVSPITEDAATIDALIPSLSTDIMPAEGNNTDKALDKAAELLNNAGFAQGDILLVSDDLDASIENSLEEMVDRGFRVSMLAVGTEDGAPIPLEKGGFLKDTRNQVILPKLDISRLHSMIESNGGLFSQLSVDDGDIERLMPLIEISTLEGESLETEIETDIWREFGPWLLLILLPLAALAFRRGYLVIAFIFILPIPQPANALSLSELFTSDNDRAMALFNDDQFEEAAELFDDKQWKASAWYRARQYELSIRLLEDLEQAEAHYNRGDALTRQGEIGKAIAAYSEAIKLNPDHEDAIYNKELLEKLQNEQEQQAQEGGNPEQQEEDESKDSEAADDGDSSQMNPEPRDDEQLEETEASENSSGNEQQTESEPGDRDEQGQPSAQSSAPDGPDEEEREQQEQNQDIQDEQEKNEQEQQQAQEQQAVEQDDENAQADEETNQETDADEQQPLSDKTVEQWMNKVPEDPGGLLRRKFKYLYKKQQENIDKANDKT